MGIQGVSLKMTTIKSQHAMSEAMKGVTRAMGRMNKQMNLPQIQKIMQQFEKESEIMDMKEEMMNELGLENMAEVGAIPSAVGEPTPAQTEEPSADLDADLEARLKISEDNSKSP